MVQEFRIPLKPEVKGRKARFEALNEFVRARHGWLTSVPGALEVTVEALPGSTLPDELRKMGHDLIEVGEGERIIPTAITERFCRGADGELELMTSGSSRQVAQIVQHAGICKVTRYAFSMALSD